MEFTPPDDSDKQQKKGPRPPAKIFLRHPLDDAPSPHPRAAVLGAQNHDDDSEQDVATVGPGAVEVELVDINLIIIGSCREAVELLKMRRRHGGRALLLWTNRPQQQHVKEEGLQCRFAKCKAEHGQLRVEPSSSQ